MWAVGPRDGASGFRFVGTLVGAFAHSPGRVLGIWLLWGRNLSVYSHFLARGRDVVYPKDMSMMIGLGTKGEAPAPGAKADDKSEPGEHRP